MVQKIGKSKKKANFTTKTQQYLNVLLPKSTFYRNGLVLHFDVHLLNSQNENIYDGIFYENREKYICVL